MIAPTPAPAYSAARQTYSSSFRRHLPALNIRAYTLLKENRKNIRTTAAATARTAYPLEIKLSAPSAAPSAKSMNGARATAAYAAASKRIFLPVLR